MNDAPAIAQTTPKKSRRWPLVLLIFLAISGIAANVFLIWEKTRGVRYQWGSQGQVASFSAGPLQVGVAPELRAEGVAAAYQATATQFRQVAFLRRETRLLRVQISAGKNPIEQGSLFCTLYGQNDEELARVNIHLDAPVQPGNSAVVEIPSGTIPNARRAVIHQDDR
jgi:hypothetical protein